MSDRVRLLVKGRSQATNVMRTLQTQLDAVQNRPTGFDYLRLTLALSVIVWHGVLVCYGPSAEIYFWTGWPRPLIGFLLPAFFALSGFLVAGSLERNKIPEFLTLRIMRIFPALAVEVLISALIIGPLLTTVQWREYFASSAFFSYFLNVIGDIHYYLPGVFNSNPTPDYVNAQLWTIPFELYCYAILTISALFGITKRTAWLFAITFGFVILMTSLPQFGLIDLPPFGPNQSLLIISFLFGVSLYIMRRHVAFSRSLFLISLSTYWIFFMNQNFVYLSALPLTYVTVFLGLQSPPKSLFIRGADYSYGVYLYGFPLQQTICYLFPSVRIWYFNALSGVALALVSAYLSWTIVESRILSQRKLGVSFVSSQAERLKRAGMQYLRSIFPAKHPLDADITPSVRLND
jgi:peptidoglycan/LPS O-acetylase OafA/YrhL